MKSYSGLTKYLPSVSNPKFKLLLTDSEIVFRDEFDGLSLLDVKTMVRKTLVPNTTFTDLNAYVYGVSSDKKFVFLAHDYVKIYRHSFWARYTIYEVATGAKTLVDETPDPSEAMALMPELQNPPKKQIHPRLEFLTWAPTGNAYAYVFKGNIYYKPRVRSKKVYPITSDGVEGKIFNGIPDWVYEGTLISYFQRVHTMNSNIAN